MNIIKICTILTSIRRPVTLSILLSGLFFFIFASITHAKDVTLQWDPNPISDKVEYYKIYYDDDASGPPYNGTGLNLSGINVASGFPLDAGTSVTISGLNEEKTYYFAVTAVNGNLLESDYSNEAIATSTPQATPDSGSYENQYVIPEMTLSGYIVDENGVGIDNAKVTIWSPKQCYASTMTSSGGGFSFENIPDSGTKYQFRVSKEGYLTFEFSSEDLLSGNLQDNIVIKNADTYIDGEITIDGVAFSGDPVEVTISYIINGFGLLAGKTISSNGTFRIDFEEVLGVSEYILTAARPGKYGDTAVRSLPASGVKVDINMSLDGDDVNALAGGSSHPVSIAGQSVSIIRVPFGGIDPSSGVTDIDINITTNPNPYSVFTSASGSELYNIDMEYQDITTILTLPFDLREVAPGDFENGNAVIYYTDTIHDFNSGTNLGEVVVEDIISVDYIGDGSTGLIEFYVDSLSPSVFGVGSASTDNPSVGSIPSQSPTGGDVGGGGGCFIDTLAYSIGNTVRFPKLLILFGVIVVMVLLRLKAPISLKATPCQGKHRS